MTGARIDAQLVDAQLLRQIRSIKQFASDATPLMKAVGVGLVRTTQDRFRSATDPEGRAWRPLSPGYAAEKRGPGILRESAMRGGLMGSITFHASGRTLIVGTNKVYGAVHQFGAVIRPKNAKALVFRIGGRTVRAKRVTIPARPYLGFGPADRAVTLRVVGVLVQKALAAR